MKKIILVILIILFVLCFSSCKRIKDADVEKGNMVMIECLTDGYSKYTVMYDRQSKVMYVANGSGGITPLYNADGTLRVYKDWRLKNESSIDEHTAEMG